MSKTWKAVCLVVALAVVLGLGVVLVPLMLTSQDVAKDSTEALPSPLQPPQPSVAGFSGQPAMGAGPLTVQFTDSSAGYGDTVSWSWDFGDGQTSTLQNPSHTYYTEGVYRASLTVTVEEEVANGEEGANGGERTDTQYTDVIVDAGAAPGRLSVRNLRIEPTYAQPNQQVTINADVVNTGGGPGSMTVSMIINGYVEQSRGVGVSPATAYPLSFVVYKATPGTYSVAVGDAVGWFYVMEPQR